MSGQVGVIILGMHRSGTSCLAGMLQCAGFFGGKVALWSPHNRKGNREDQRINDLNDRVLDSSGGSWRAVPDRICWTPETASERDKVLRDLADSQAPWMFKDPRTLITLPFWQDADASPKRLGIWRNPLSVAQSLATRNGLPMAKGLELWAIYNTALIREHQRAAFPILCFDLPRDEFIAAVRAALNTLCGGLVSPGRLDLDRIAEFFDDTLVNQSVGREDPVAALSGLPGVDASLIQRVANLYQALCAASSYTASVEKNQSKTPSSSQAILSGLIGIEKAAAEGDLEGAYRACNEMLKSSPQRADLWLRLVDLAKASGDRDQLASSIKRGLAMLPADPHLWFEQAKFHWKARAFDEAFLAAKRATETAPDWIELRLQLGAWAAARRRWTEVKKRLAPLVSEGKSNSRSQVLLGVASIHLGEIERGNELIAAAIERMDAKERVDGLRRWGLALQSAGQEHEACDKLSESLALDPAAAGVAVALAALQHELGNAEAALGTLRKARDAGTDSPALRLTSARIRQNLGQDPNQDIAAGLVLDPHHLGLRQFAGHRAYTRGEFSQALEHFLIARSGHNPVGALLGAARCHVKLGNPASASALLDELLSREPGHVQARRMRDALAR